jgi:hypothetical protein
MEIGDVINLKIEEIGIYRGKRKGELGDSFGIYQGTKVFIKDSNPQIGETVRAKIGHIDLLWAAAAALKNTEPVPEERPNKVWCEYCRKYHRDESYHNY